MDEIAQRIAAHELALIEVVAHIDRDHIREGIKAIRAGLVVGITEEERVIRIAAIELLEDAATHYDQPAVRMHWKGAGSYPPSRSGKIHLVLRCSG